MFLLLVMLICLLSLLTEKVCNITIMFLLLCKLCAAVVSPPAMKGVFDIIMYLGMSIAF